METDRMGDELKVRCACGWEVRGSEEEVVVATREHGARLHNMAATREQVLAMAVASEPAGAEAPDRTTP